MTEVREENTRPIPKTQKVNGEWIWNDENIGDEKPDNLIPERLVVCLEYEEHLERVTKWDNQYLERLKHDGIVISRYICRSCKECGGAHGLERDSFEYPFFLSSSDRLVWYPYNTIGKTKEPPFLVETWNY